jgi:hypothetical protein
VPAVKDWVWPRPAEWALLGAVGVTSVIGQLLMTHALRYVRAAVGGIIAQLTPITSLALGWALLGDRIGLLAGGGRGADAGGRQRGRLPRVGPRSRSRRRVKIVVAAGPRVPVDGGVDGQRRLRPVPDLQVEAERARERDRVQDVKAVHRPLATEAHARGGRLRMVGVPNRSGVDHA